MHPLPRRSFVRLLAATGLGVLTLGSPASGDPSSAAAVQPFRQSPPLLVGKAAARTAGQGEARA